MPITVGGSVNSLADARILFEAGADKVLVNSASYNSPELLGNIADIFGSQALVAGVDFLRADDKTILFSHSGSVSEVKDLREHLEAVQESRVGEIMLQAIDRDGTKVGLDKEAIIDALSVTAVPLIVAGGIGDYSHIREAFDLGVDGVACGTLFNFGDNNPVRAKAYLRNHGIPLKISSFHGYAV